MAVSFIFFAATLSLVAARPLSLFQLSFEDVLQDFDTSGSSGGGETPASTYPLVLKPLNYAPGIVAPPAYLYPNPIKGFSSFGDPNAVPGAIPLFKPMTSFPFLNFMPVVTSFYLSEPNVRLPLPGHAGGFPSKVAAPGPAFSPIRDTQVLRKPSVDFGASAQTLKEDESFIDDEHYVQVVHFPSAIGEDLFSMRGEDDVLAGSAPGGIVQSGQPHFSYVPFRNSKASENLSSPSGFSPLMDLTRREGEGPTIIEA